MSLSPELVEALGRIKRSNDAEEQHLARLAPAGVNWKVFWRCWEAVMPDPYQATIRTPWFQVSVSCGGKDWANAFFSSDHIAWYGIRAYWSHAPGWHVKNGGILFREGDAYPSFTRWPLRYTLGSREELT